MTTPIKRIGFGGRNGSATIVYYPHPYFLYIYILKSPPMKRIIYLLLLFPFICFSQAPQGVNYQAVAYDSDGFELSNKEVGVRISIVEGTAFGTPQLIHKDLNPF